MLLRNNIMVLRAHPHLFLPIFTIFYKTWMLIVPVSRWLWTVSDSSLMTRPLLERHLISNSIILNQLFVLVSPTSKLLWSSQRLLCSSKLYPLSALSKPTDSLSRYIALRYVTNNISIQNSVSGNCLCLGSNHFKCDRFILDAARTENQSLWRH